ncbi:MAG: hypothetical protein R6U04_02595 [Bacteroidales bacterium]
MEKADSSTVGVAMLGFDLDYSTGGTQFKGQFYYTSLSNTGEYNVYTSENNQFNDLGSEMLGY